MGEHTANISRHTYDETRRNQMLVNQQGVPWVDADDNEQRWIFYNLLLRLTQGFIGNGAMNDGFKIVGSGLANNFTIAGGNGTLEGAGRLLVEGFQCVLPINRNYKGTDNLECTPVSTGLTQTILTDSAANFTLGGANNNLAGRTLVPDITQPGKTYTITANTQTTITISGNMLNDGIQARAHYRVELSTPSANRIDEVYIDCYLDEIDGVEDPQIKHTLGMEIETQRRLKLIQNIFVAEGGTVPINYIDADGNQHYTLKLATIQRYAGQSAINPTDITDNRPSVDQTLIETAIEVINARGSKNSLAARLNVFLDNDGYPKPIPIGTKMVFYQPCVPTGWLQITGINDRLLRFVDEIGGEIGGSWTLTGISIGGAGGHSHDTVGDHSHTVVGNTDTFGANMHADGATGGGSLTGSHAHSLNASVSSAGGHNHGAVADHAHSLAHDGNWRPAYADCVVGEYQG